ncbi:MAG: SDR family NAD(P)-dependent oxidoreductase [Caulobacteraceae bacterium]|nr:SDR family NAD(P)-dependent oxidoreductase [Caulobacteraceae bacterium]
MARPELMVAIVGASRGLGLGLATEFLRRGARVIGTVREPAGGSGLHALVGSADGRLEIETADVTDGEGIAALRQRLARRRLDVLMVNAGVAGGDAQGYEEAFFRTMTVNVLGVMNVVRTLSVLMADNGALAVMSSGLGSVGRNSSGGMEPYRSSKAALNQSLRSFAAEHADAPWSTTAIAPGWVRTDMGGPGAPLDVETSCRGVADVLESRLGGRGCAFLDYRGEVIPW